METLTKALKSVEFSRRIPKQRRNGYQADMIALHDEIERMHSIALRIRQSWRYNENAELGRLIAELLGEVLSNE